MYLYNPMSPSKLSREGQRNKKVTSLSSGIKNVVVCKRNEFVDVGLSASHPFSF